MLLTEDVVIPGSWIWILIVLILILVAIFLVQRVFRGR